MTNNNIKSIIIKTRDDLKMIKKYINTILIQHKIMSSGKLLSIIEIIIFIVSQMLRKCIKVKGLSVVLIQSKPIIVDNIDFLLYAFILNCAMQRSSPSSILLNVLNRLRQELSTICELMMNLVHNTTNSCFYLKRSALYLSWIHYKQLRDSRKQNQWSYIIIPQTQNKINDDHSCLKFI